MNIILEMLTYFIIYSFGGWVLESIFKTFYEKRLVNSGFLHGPFCPIYGVGCFFMFLCLDSFKTHPALVFIIAFFALSIWEYFVGWALEKMFHTKYWDYTQNRFNIKGRVCLFNSLIWGFLGLLFIYFIHPFVGGEIAKIPQNILIHFNVLIYTYLLVDMIASIIKVKNIEIRLKNINELGDAIKQKLEELKQYTENNKQEGQENIQKMVEELKIKQSKLVKRVYRHVLRLKKAFPTMQASERITEFLNQRVELVKKGKRNEKEK